MGSSMGSFRAQGSSLAPPSWSSQPSPFSQQLSKDSWEIGWARSGGGAHHFCPHFIGQTLTVWGPETERFLKPARAFLCLWALSTVFAQHPSSCGLGCLFLVRNPCCGQPARASAQRHSDLPRLFPRDAGPEAQARLLHYCRCKFTTYFPAL